MALWTPDRLGSPLKAWYDATELVLSDTNAVATWPDLSGNSNDITEATNRPTYRTNIKNSLPVVRFDGSNDRLSKSGGITGIGAQPLTFFFALDSNTAGRRLFNVGTTFAIGHEATNVFRMFAGTNFDYVASNTNWNVHVCVFNGASSLGSLNGTASSLTNAGTNAASGDFSVGSSLSPSSFLSGDFGEIGVVNGALATADRLKVEGYLGHKWGITLASGHPYENNAPTTSGKTGLKFCISVGLRQRTLR
jgi:hypothetical protein